MFTGSQNWKNSVNLNKIFRYPAHLANTSDERINDMALINTNDKFSQDHFGYKYYYLNTICLPKEVLLNENYEDVILSGWGIINKSGTFPLRLQIGETELEPNENCDPGLLCALHYEDEPGTCRVSFFKFNIN